MGLDKQAFERDQSTGNFLDCRGCKECDSVAKCGKLKCASRQVKMACDKSCQYKTAAPSSGMTWKSMRGRWNNKYTHTGNALGGSHEGHCDCSNDGSYKKWDPKDESSKCTCLGFCDLKRCDDVEGKYGGDGFKSLIGLKNFKIAHVCRKAASNIEVTCTKRDAKSVKMKWYTPRLNNTRQQVLRKPPTLKESLEEYAKIAERQCPLLDGTNLASGLAISRYCAGCTQCGGSMKPTAAVKKKKKCPFECCYKAREAGKKGWEKVCSSTDPKTFKTCRRQCLPCTKRDQIKDGKPPCKSTCEGHHKFGKEPWAKVCTRDACMGCKKCQFKGWCSATKEEELGELDTSGGRRGGGGGLAAEAMFSACSSNRAGNDEEDEDLGESSMLSAGAGGRRGGGGFDTASSFTIGASSNRAGNDEEDE